MSTKVMKVKDPKIVIKVDGYEFELKTINIDMRCEIMDMLIATEGTPSFTTIVDIILIATHLSKDELMEYSNQTLSSLGTEITKRCDTGSVKKK